MMCCVGSRREPTTISRSRSICRFCWPGSRGCCHEAGQQEEPAEFHFAGKQIDFGEQRLRWDGGEQPLTLMEATLLRYLVRHEGQTVSRKALLEKVWGVRQDTDTRTVDNFIVRLRRYIEADPSHPVHLQTVRGVGYRFVAAPDR